MCQAGGKAEVTVEAAEYGGQEISVDRRLLRN
jgi:hypothetical protein